MWRIPIISTLLVISMILEGWTLRINDRIWDVGRETVIPICLALILIVLFV